MSYNDFVSIFEKNGRPTKERGFNNSKSIEYNDDFLKTVIVKVRVSFEEKAFIKKLMLRKRYNISSYVRALIFDVYRERLLDKESMAPYILGVGDCMFTEYREEFIHIRFTEREKYEVQRLALYYHKSISDFIRWVVLQLPVDEIVSSNY